MRAAHTLLLGFIIGLSAATIGACSSTPECGPQSCAGCCTPQGQCMGGMLLQECGTGGAACTACQGLELCQGGLCTPFRGPGRPDGGATGDAGMDGGLTDGGTSDGGFNPDGGGQDGGWNSAFIGQPCMTSAECGGAPGTCIPPSSWPGGYCTADCTTAPALCGSQGACVEVASGVRACFDRCASMADCRTEYKCSVLPQMDGGFATSLTCIPKCAVTGCQAGYTCDPGTGFCCNAQSCY